MAPRLSRPVSFFAHHPYGYTAYLLTTAALQLLFGRFYTFFSIKWVYLIAIFIFEVGSLICAVANNSLTLIIGRAVAGVGSAGIFSGALTILAYSVPLSKRPIYTGAIGSMYGLASISGPLMGMCVFELANLLNDESQCSR